MTSRSFEQWLKYSIIHDLTSFNWNVARFDHVSFHNPMWHDKNVKFHRIHLSFIRINNITRSRHYTDTLLGSLLNNGWNIRIFRIIFTYSNLWPPVIFLTRRYKAGMFVVRLRNTTNVCFFCNSWLIHVKDMQRMNVKASSLQLFNSNRYDLDIYTS